MDDQRKESARERALRSPELLEIILSHLPLTAILASAMRVSHSWNTAIIRSPPLRKQLSLPTATDHIVTPKEYKDLEGIKGSIPLYSEDIRTNLLLRSYQEYRSLEEYRLAGRGKVPWWLHYTTRRENLKITWCPEGYGVLLGLRPQSYGEAHAHPDDGAEESWRHMFISRPPCTVVQASLVKLIGDEGRPQRMMKIGVNFSVRDHGGVTFGLLEDIFTKVCASPVNFDQADADQVESNGFGGHGCFELFRTHAESEDKLEDEVDS